VAERTAAQVILSDTDAADRARRHFADCGFEVGPFVGISFSIAGTPGRFRETFGGAEPDPKGGELPIDSLPDDLRQAVQAVATDEPPAFGPGNP
jgi:hypothetical protein